ncbi:MAG: hypothetical protein AAGA31_06045 [Bacteroidota bacterium]
MIRLLFVLLLFFISSYNLAAQDICDDNNCSEELDKIKLEQPSDPVDGVYSTERTDAFRLAYDQFKSIKNDHQASTDWQSKYNTSSLGGRKCLMYYDLESRFAYEYDKNPAFKAYIDRIESNPKAFQQSGFESSRRGMNLQRRLGDNCPKEVLKSEKDGTSELNDRKAVYQRLGEVQGYWDEQGNTLKPLEVIPPASATPTKKKSKKQQVEELTQAVSALPIGQEPKDKIDQLASGLTALTDKAAALTEQIDKTAKTIDDLLPKPGGLADQIGNLLGLKKPLSSFQPKIPGSGIVDKIKGWFGKGKKLKKKAEQLRDQAQQLQQDAKEIVDKARQTSEQIKQKGQDIAKLKDKLAELQRKKDDLTTQLGDKPKKILDQLHQEVADAKQKAKDLQDKIATGAADKDQLQEALDKLNDQRNKLEERIQDVSDQVTELDEEEDKLKEAGELLQQEADQLQKQGELLNQVEDLEPAPEVASAADACAEELKELLASLTQVEEKKKKRRFSLGKILAFPGKLLGKVTGFLDKHRGLKTLLSAIPGVSNIVNVVDGLFGKTKGIAQKLELITDKQNKLTERLDVIAGKVEKARKVYDDKVAVVRGVQDKLAQFTDNKTGLVDILSKPLNDLTGAEAKVAELIKEHGLLGANSACNDVAPAQQELEEADQELDEMEPEIQEMEEELNDLETQVQEVEGQTEAVEADAQQAIDQHEEVVEEEEAIKKEFGQEVDLEPVSVAEYAESFEIERPFWEATFHPDDEVVEGYKGRYFQVQLKDADKTIKLLFGPGEYHMSKTDFRDQYGSVIGAFVTEALAAIKKDQREGVKLFVQGSADISGARSFKGNLDESFYYDELTLLPLKGSENFGGAAESRNIPERGFTNEDLPNLRGRFMQEMIGYYSKKLDPILLEGSVKEKVDKEDRNAVIYLFLPEYLLEE